MKQITLITLFFISLNIFAQPYDSPAIELIKGRRYKANLLHETWYTRNNKAVYKKTHILIMFNKDGTEMYTNENVQNLKKFRLDDDYEIVTTDFPSIKFTAMDPGGYIVRIFLAYIGIDNNNKPEYQIAIKYGNICFNYTVNDTKEYPVGHKPGPEDDPNWNNMQYGFDEITYEGLKVLNKKIIKAMTNPGSITEKDYEELRNAKGK